MITPGRALDIARDAIIGKANTSEDFPVQVQRKAGNYVVTFVRINPPGVRGPDYDAQVTINAESGAVIQILGAS